MQNGKNSSTAIRKILTLPLAKLTIDRNQLIECTTHPVPTPHTQQNCKQFLQSASRAKYVC